MRSRLFSRLRPGRGDDGYALLTVIAAMFVLTILATGALGYALNGVKSGKRGTDWTASLAAAQAGIDDFLAKLNADEGYWKKTPRYGMENSAQASVDCTNTAMQVAVSTGSAPCGWTATTATGWRNVASSSSASYHYDVDTSTTLANGVLRIASTGKVGAVTRTVTAQLRRGGFGEFLYLSDIETIDPANISIWGKGGQYDSTWAQTNCNRYYYPSPVRNSNCTGINFTGGDVINGPLHTNDAMMMQQAQNGTSPVFNGDTTTSYPNCQSATPSTCYRANGTVNPTFAKGIKFRDNVTMPTTVAGLKGQTDAAKVSNPGCLYTGPTRILFTNDGKMKVWSPYTTSVNARCGALAALQNPAGNGATVDVPANNLIYVQDVPSAQTRPADAACLPNSVAPGFPQQGDFNMTDLIETTKVTKTTTQTNTKPARYSTVTTTEVTDPYGATTTTTSNPTSSTGPAGTTTSTSSRTVHAALGVEAKCRTGTVYIEGALKGKVSVVSDNTIVVTGDLTYADGHVVPAYTGHGQSVLGLIASNSVMVYHPIRCSSVDSDQTCSAGSHMGRQSTGSTFENAKIHASILTLQHSIGVQAHDIDSSLGKLTVFGSMAQKFRGVVGTASGSGYKKDYNYDDALKYDPPPFFLDPTSGSWGVKTFAEVTAAYRP
jgi:Tfp pilus assembly protein PilX